jgi:predicted DNA-binding antitoxin AbrB/MazE fold protein
MAKPVEAVYEHGVFKPLGPVDLQEGQAVSLSVEPTVTRRARANDSPFWRSSSLDELAERQKVSPATDLNEISALWPVDDDPDALLDHILSERRFRRVAANAGA